MTKFSFLKPLYFGLAWISLFLGFLGIFLPLLPTTPFLLLTAFLFSKSSEKWTQYIHKHPRFGPPIRDWQTNRIIRRPAKLKATVGMLLLGIPSFVFGPKKLGLQIFLICLYTCVLFFIWTRKEKDEQA
ncbi:MAG: YbaN family protein [Bdellovibrionales bacterium]